jgi:hypothetical protein
MLEKMGYPDRFRLSTAAHRSFGKTFDKPLNLMIGPAAFFVQ